MACILPEFESVASKNSKQKYVYRTVEGSIETRKIMGSFDTDTEKIFSSKLTKLYSMVYKNTKHAESTKI